MVAVVADSAANLPEELARELGIELVPLWLTFGSDQYRDGVDMPPARFYERLISEREPASTATPSPGAFAAAFERTRQRDIVCITVASTMSAVHHVALTASERFDGRAVVVDSTNASMAEGFVALEAARRARAGASLEDVVARAREVAGVARLFATVDTFEFLRRSGRVNALRAYVATVVASAGWIAGGAVWAWRGWPNLWAPRPTKALPVAAAVSSAVILSRFAMARKPA